MANELVLKLYALSEASDVHGVFHAGFALPVASRNAAARQGNEAFERVSSVNAPLLDRFYCSTTT